MKLFEMLEKIKGEEIGSIAYFAETNEANTDFKNFEYFTIEKDGFLFYVQNGEYFGFNCTIYKKIDYNHKQQIAYPINFTDYEELKKIIIEKTANLMSKNYIPGTCEQIIYHELITYVNKTQTLLTYLKEIAGYREKEILENIDHITMNLNNTEYLVLEFHNKDGQSFAINTKNIDRLIIS